MLMSWPMAILLWTAGAALSGSTVLDPSWPMLLWQHVTVHLIAIGVAAGLGVYLFSLPESQPVHYRTAWVKALAGGVFGLIAAKAGAGFGVNESLQTAAAGIGGAKGPEYVDKLTETLMRGKP